MKDMKYIPRNVMRQHSNFENIRSVGGSEMIHDVYVRDPKSNVFWFCGKVARVSGTTPPLTMNCSALTVESKRVVNMVKEESPHNTPPQIIDDGSFI
jgi:hypothetical protein